MRWIAILLLPLALASCSHDTDVTPSYGRLWVSVQNEFGQPVPGKLIEIPYLGLVQYTETDGLAKFALPPGDYVVRAHDIGGPGPALIYVDQDATVTAGETTNVVFVDCQTCVAPAGGGSGS